MIYDQGNGYSAVYSEHSALNNIITLFGYPDISAHPLIKRFTKGVFNLRPPTVKYTQVWDVSKVLLFLKSLGANNHDITLKWLTLKMITLMMLLSGDRVNTLTSLKITLLYVP